MDDPRISTCFRRSTVISPNKTNISFLIFDLDGTLIDSKGDVGAALNRTLEENKIAAVSSEVIRRHVGYGIQPIIVEKLAEVGITDCGPAFKAFTEYYLARCAHDTVLYDGVAELLKDLSNVRKVILTNKSVHFIETILMGLGIKDHFVAAYGRESFARTKPDPLPILSILNEHGVAPEAALMIGDTETDIHAGQNAGIATCLFTGGYGRSEVLETLAPTYRIDHMMDLIPLVTT